MTIRDQIVFSIRDLFPTTWLARRHTRFGSAPAPSAAVTKQAQAGETGRIGRLRAKFQELGTFIQRCFYSLALIGSIVVPVLAVSLIWSMRESMLIWHQKRIFADVEARRLSVLRLNSADQDDILSREVYGKSPPPARPAGTFDQTEEAFFRNTLAKKWQQKLGFEFSGVFGTNTKPIPFGPGDAYTDNNNFPIVVLALNPTDSVLSEIRILWRADHQGAGHFEGDGMEQVLLHEEEAENLGLNVKAPADQPQWVDVYYVPSLQTWPSDDRLLKKYKAPPNRQLTGRVRVMGIFTGSLGRAIMTHKFFGLYMDRAWCPHPFYKAAQWGPLRDGWTDDRIVEAVRPRMTEMGVTVEPVVVGGQRFLFLERIEQAGPMIKEHWESGIRKPLELRLVNANLLTAADTKGSPQADSPGLTFGSSVPLKAEASPIQLDRIRVEVNTLEQLVKTRDLVVNDLKLATPDEERVKGAQRVIAQNQAWQGVQWIVIGITAFLSLVGLFLALSQRIQQKTSEVGILRAFGAPPGLICGILLWQSSLLWIIAATISSVLAPMAYATFSPAFMRMTDTSGDSGPAASQLAAATELPPFPAFPWQPLCITAIIAFGLVFLVTLFGGLRAARLLPANALKVR